MFNKIVDNMPLNRRINEIKNHSMNNSFLYAMKKKINSS